MFLTGDTLNPSTREFLKRVGLPSLPKPFAISELCTKVADILCNPPGDA
jgi:hypothetical protein